MSETWRNPSCLYLSKSQSFDKFNCTSLADWKLWCQLLPSHSTITMKNAIGTVQHVWLGCCGRTSRAQQIMQLCLSTRWSFNSLISATNGATIYCTTSTHSTQYFVNIHSSFSTTKKFYHNFVVWCGIYQFDAAFSSLVQLYQSFECSVIFFFFTKISTFNISCFYLYYYLNKIMCVTFCLSLRYCGCCHCFWSSFDRGALGGGGQGYRRVSRWRMSSRINKLEFYVN